MNLRLAIKTTTLALWVTLGGCAGTPVAPDGGLLQRVDTVMRQAAPAMSVAVKLSTTQVKTGDAIAAEVGSAVPGYVYLFQIGTDGHTLSLVFPNAMDGANYINAGATLGLPRPNWRMAARGPAGVGHLMAVVTANPLDILALQANVALGKLEVSAPYGAAMVTVRETAP